MLERTSSTDVKANVVSESASSTTFASSQNSARQKRKLAKGLSIKLLLLTMAFVMIAEVLIFVPSVANFRNTWLQNHLDTAESASIVYLDASDTMLSDKAQLELLKATQSINVAIRAGGKSQLMASMPMDAEVGENIKLGGGMQLVTSIRSALSTLFFGGDRAYHVYGKMKSRDAEIHLIQEDIYLKEALRTYARNILIISLLISAFTAALVFWALYRMIVLPIIKISANMDAFSKTPENANLIYKPSNREDEIGLAEERLSSLQSDLQSTLRQKQHLADLGLAVSKINHDLRNILASAHLFSDRLMQLPDPTVQKFAPKLLRTLDRAASYTKAVLSYGRATESKPKLRRNKLYMIIEDVGDSLGLGKANSIASELNDSRTEIEWQNKVPKSLELLVDTEQIFRAVLNIARNAMQAMIEQEAQSIVKKLTIEAEQKSDETLIWITDTGPGIPDHQAEKLFKAFEASNRTGGTGLGLAISTELVRAHGGTIELEGSSSSGTTFLIKLPNGD